MTSDSALPAIAAACDHSKTMLSRLLPAPPSQTRGLPNLMAALAATFGAKANCVSPLPDLPAELATARTVILLVIDGMGEAQLARHLGDTLLGKCPRMVLDSVFPTTTATAVGTFLTGMAPVSHSLTGWHLWSEEIGETVAILPMRRRSSLAPVPEAEQWAERILNVLPFADRLPVAVTHVMPAWIAHSPFNQRMAGHVRHQPYGATPDLFTAVERAMASQDDRHFIYAYWPDFDTAAHDHGPDHATAVARLRGMVHEIESFVARQAGSDAVLLVTADHGFITAPVERQIDLADHPDLVECLARPLSGERRVAYAHIKPGRGEYFAEMMADRFGHALWVMPSASLIDGGWFGNGRRHDHFLSRIGDYTLILKDDWTILDTRPGDRQHPMLGMHGGVSEAEMRVPLCWIAL